MLTCFWILSGNICTFQAHTACFTVYNVLKCYKRILNIIIDVKPVQATEINNNALTGNKRSDIFIHNELGKGFVCLCSLTDVCDRISEEIHISFLVVVNLLLCKKFTKVSVTSFSHITVTCIKHIMQAHASIFIKMCVFRHFCVIFSFDFKNVGSTSNVTLSADNYCCTVDKTNKST